MKKKLIALVCACALAIPLVSHSQSPSTQGNNGAPTGTGGVRILGSDGTYDRALRLDANGNFVMVSGGPVMEVITHKSNITVASAGYDSSLIPIPVDSYRQIYALLRIKAATFAATGYLQLGIRGHLAASYDSTAVGWSYPMGSGTRQSKSIQLATLNDRWKMIPVVDSLSGVPFQAPYMSVFMQNLTGAQEIHDLWLLGVR